MTTTSSTNTTDPVSLDDYRQRRHLPDKPLPSVAPVGPLPQGQREQLRVVACGRQRFGAIFGGRYAAAKGPETILLVTASGAYFSLTPPTERGEVWALEALTDEGAEALRDRLPVSYPAPENQAVRPGR